MFFQIFMSKGDTVQVFLRNNSLWTVQFPLTNLQWHGFNILIFQRKEGRFISLAWKKKKKQNEIQRPYFFLNKFVINHVFVVSHFSDLWKLVIWVKSMVLCCFLFKVKVIWVYYLLSINPDKVMSGCLYFPSDLEGIKGHLYMQQVVKLTVIRHRWHGFCYESDLISHSTHRHQYSDINIY